MKKLTLLLAAALGVSLLINVMTFQRLSKGDAPRPAAKKNGNGNGHAPMAGDDEPAPVVTGDKMDYLIHEVAKLRREVADMKASGPAAAAAPSKPASNPSTPAAPARDPEIAAILAEQDRFNQFWGDLGKLSGARKQLDDARYVQAVLDSTADFLGLAEPQRSQFTETARLSIADLQKANKDYQEASKTIQWDKANPKQSQEQWNAVNKAYKDAQAAAYDRIKSQLDSSQPRQKQFMGQVDSWARYIVPWGGGWRGEQDGVKY
jgi:hypothetical protein